MYIASQLPLPKNFARGSPLLLKKSGIYSQISVAPPKTNSQAALPPQKFEVHVCVKDSMASKKGGRRLVSE